MADENDTLPAPQRGLTVDQKRTVWRLICQEHKGISATAREIGVTREQVRSLLRTKPFADHLNWILKNQNNNTNFLRYEIVAEAQGALDRMLDRVNNDERDADGKPIISAAAKNQIDFKILDTAIPARMEIDVRRHIEVPDPAVRNVNRVLAELGDPDVIEAEVEKTDEPVPGPDQETPRES